MTAIAAFFICFGVVFGLGFIKDWFIYREQIVNGLLFRVCPTFGNVAYCLATWLQLLSIPFTAIALACFYL